MCKRLLVAIELSSGLEEAGLCLQAVVMCYGLLAPLIQNRLIAPPLAKVQHNICVISAYVSTYIRTYILLYEMLNTVCTVHSIQYRSGWIPLMLTVC